LPLIAPLAVLWSPAVVAALCDRRRWRPGWLVQRLAWVALAGSILIPVVRYVIERGSHTNSLLAMTGTALLVSQLVLRAHSSALRSALPALALIAVYSNLALGWVDLADSSRSARPFIDRLSEVTEPGETVACFRGDENTRAILSFYAQRPVEFIDHYEELLGSFRRHPSTPVVFTLRLRDGESPPVVGERGWAHEIFATAASMPRDMNPEQMVRVEVLAGNRVGRHRCLAVAKRVD